MDVLTRRQREIFNFLRDNYESFAYPPSLDELCAALGMASRGSLYKHIMALIAAGLVEPFTGKKKGGVRLTAQAQNEGSASEAGLPFIGSIAAGNCHYLEAVMTGISRPSTDDRDCPLYGDEYGRMMFDSVPKAAGHECI